MRNRVERLRVWLLGSAVFLLLVIAAYVGVAHHLRRSLLKRLPGQLGINIVSEANGYDTCRSNGARTIFCLHAAKQFGYTNGKIALHDVSVILYGQKGDRRDRIYGDDFEYDPKNGVIRALGVVHIDLQAADATGAPTADAAAKPGEFAEATGAKVVHVTTSGLVYLQNLGVAATNDPIEFQAAGMTGHATGADYSSDSGLLALHSAVSMSGISAGQPVTVTAATAQFDEHSQQVFLTHAQYESQGRTVGADQATLHRRADGTLARVEAKGNVTIRAQGATTVSQSADVALNDESRAQQAVLKGGVLYTVDEPLRQARGQADEATITFDKQAKPQPEHALLAGAVHIVERTRATEAAREPWSVRDLTAEKFEAELARADEGKPQMRDAEAMGNAHLTVIDNGSLAGGAGKGRRELSADDLKAHLREAGNAKQPTQLDTIAGRGHTVLRQVNVDGVEQTSTGDTLDAKFRPATGKARPAAGRRGAEDLDAESLASALQQGHVTMVRRAPAKAGGAGEDVRHATAERAAYDGDADRVTLTGGVQMTGAGSILWANQVALDQATGDAHALGGVKVNYVQDPAKVRPGRVAQSTEPTHILADRAELEQATNIATFYGKPVRVWQGASQVQAPEVELAPNEKRLIARGAGLTGWSAATQAAQVHTVLSSGEDGAGPQSSAAAGGAAARCGPGTTGAGKAGMAAGASQVVRVASGGLIYSGVLGKAEFTGGVRAETLEGIIHASQATAYQTQAQAGAGEAAGGGPADGIAAASSLDGKFDRVVASGQVAMEGRGLKATGERLLYTPGDHVYLLTGTKDAPPEAMDAQGTTTGAALRVRNTCDASGGVSVEVLGEVPGEPAQRVRTESRVHEEKNANKGKK